MRLLLPAFVLSLASLAFGLTPSVSAAQVAHRDVLRLDEDLQDLLEAPEYGYEATKSLFIEILTSPDRSAALGLIEKYYYRDGDIMNKSSGTRKAFREALVATAREEATQVFLDRFLSGEYMRIEVAAGGEWSENLRNHELADMIEIAPSVLGADRATDLLKSLYQAAEDKPRRSRSATRNAVAAAFVEIGTDETFAFLDTVRNEIGFSLGFRSRLMYSPDDRAAEIIIHRLGHVEELVSEDSSWTDDPESVDRRLRYIRDMADGTLRALIGEHSRTEQAILHSPARGRNTGVERWSIGTLRHIQAQLGALTPRLLDYGIEQNEIKRVKDRLDEIIEERRRNR